MTDIPNRLQIKIDTASAFAAADYEGQPGIESSYYVWRYYAGGIPRYSCPGDIAGACRAARVYVGGVECISPTRAGYFTSLWLPAAISGQILRAGAGGEIVNSSLSEDANSINSSKPITVNNAARPAWALWDVPVQLSSLAAIYTITGAGGQVGFARNFYVNPSGNKVAIVSGTGLGYPSQLHVDDNGRLRFYASQNDPVANETISDMDLRLEVNRFGGAGFFGVTAPTTRPTVNAACTDLATCIALTNQLRTHLIACGLVQ